MGSSLRQKVQSLRTKDKTYSEINNILHTSIPKSTLSYWCKDITVSPEYRKKVHCLVERNLSKARVKARLANKTKRMRFLKSLRDKNAYLLKNLDVSTQKLLLSVLYLAEGAKHKSTKCLLLGSSDPKMIIFYLNLLKNCYKLNTKKFRVRIQCRFDQDERDLEIYWHKIRAILPYLQRR